MAILFKAMTRPAMFLGVPIMPLILVVGICFILDVYFTKFFWLAIPVAVFILRMIAKRDDHIFTLYFLKLKLLGKSVTNRFFNARAFLSSPYEPINIDEFIHAMKLNDRITLDNYIPYPAMLTRILSKRWMDVMFQYSSYWVWHLIPLQKPNLYSWMHS